MNVQIYRTLLWFLFLTIPLFTWGWYLFGWMYETYEPVLASAGLIALVVGIVIVTLNPTRRTIAAVVSGIAIGQWWFFEMTLFQLLWMHGTYVDQ